MTSTITQQQQDSIEALIAKMDIPAGLGDRENACSVAAINLALTGELKDEIPACMSRVIGKWIIRTQDAMPTAIRNSTEWKRLLPLAAGTGRAFEKERLAIILDHMWMVVLPTLQPMADKKGFGKEWRDMTTLKTKESALTAKKAAADAADAAYAADAADAAAYAAADAADAADADADAAAADDAAYAADAASAAYAYAAADAAAADAAFWAAHNPVALLQKLIAVTAT